MVICINILYVIYLNRIVVHSMVVKCGNWILFISTRFAHPGILVYGGYSIFRIQHTDGSWVLLWSNHIFDYNSTSDVLVFCLLRKSVITQLWISVLLMLTKMRVHPLDRILHFLEIIIILISWRVRILTTVKCNMCSNIE